MGQFVDRGGESVQHEPAGKEAVGGDACFAYRHCGPADVMEREGLLKAEIQKREDAMAILAHELRGPLAAIANALDLLRSEADAEQRLWCIGLIERQRRQMSRIVEDVIDAARGSCRGSGPRFRESDLRTILESSVETVHPLFEGRGRSLTISRPPCDVRLMADPGKLQQAFVNLLMNAAKFTADGGRVEVRAGLVGRQVVVVVEDDGVGIAPDLLRRVFDLFSRGPHGEDGLGVGLAVVRSVVELHAGTVEVQSDGAGRGSRFIVRLPAICPDDARPTGFHAPRDWPDLPSTDESRA